jgi:hypothetical protein
MKTTKLLGLFALALLLTGPVFGAANIVIVNVNAPGVGFNDPTPAAPVGGNPGTTVGQQALNVFQYAANVWGSILDSPVTIYIQASFVPLACTPTAGTLGSAGPIQVFGGFPNAELPDTWYHVALANKLAGADLAPGPNGTANDDIVARFNSALGTPGCLTTLHWYYGLDDNHGANIDLATVLLHEFAHGLGFSGFYNKATGQQLAGFPDVYGTYTFSTTLNKSWPQMTDAERKTSTLDTNHVVWTGINVTAAVPQVLQFGTPLVTFNTPASLGNTRVGTAAFGPALSSPGITGDVVLAHSGAATDGCAAVTDNVTGKIALMDRGVCGFVVKVRNAQLAGAIAVLIADNVAGSPPAGLGGADPTITIPSARISKADGDRVKTALAAGTVNATLGVNSTIRAGADASGRALLNAPNPVVLGSSISHWDPIAFPNLLMEPAINADLTHSVDLTRQEMIDIGWFSDGDGVPDGVDQCIGSSRAPTVVISGCDTKVPNITFPTGCKISDRINDCTIQWNPRAPLPFLSCVVHLYSDLKTAGVVITRDQRSAIDRCIDSFEHHH